ncbi:AHH domain-containing protein [Bradyrhizobium liaoningense]|uniref:AHH domain-containing protein n=1 Tax=Bradyrhizobium liaoningense TaxID=43992 RepID=UPI001BA7608E|nr:AHH domain-containing protein [Bradyrhizobium liaoningense]MBR0856767.1 AHH domain-containing protein [Bradyrhizobium liaoningense]
MPNHHILPQRFASHPVMDFLRERFDIDAIRNRMSLPPKQSVADDLNASPHTGGHLGTYYRGFCEYLEQVQTSAKYAAARAGDTRELDDVASDVHALVGAAKYALANGHLFANTPTGMTSEEANAVNQQWFKDWRKYAADNRTRIQQMQETVDQFYTAGRADAALDFPLLSPTRDRSMADRIEIIKRLPKDSPISLQFNAVGPVPDPPGLIPSLIDTRLRGLSSPAHSDLNEKEGLTPSDPRFSGKLPAFPMPGSDEQRLGQLPPSTAMPAAQQVLQFHPETSDLLKLSDGSPLMGPDPYNVPHDPADRAAVLRGMAIFATAMATPALLPLLPALAPLAALGLGGATAARAEPTRDRRDGASATGAPPYRPFNSDSETSNSSDIDPRESRSVASQASGNSFDQSPTSAGTFDNRFGNWSVTPSGIVPDPPSRTNNPPVAGGVAPEDVRRLTRVNEANAGSVFSSGSAPVPYLPSTEFNERFGSWAVPTADARQSQPSKPIGAFTDEPTYLMPPPIFGVDGSDNPHNDAEEWFSRWIRPLLRSE